MTPEATAAIEFAEREALRTIVPPPPGPRPVEAEGTLSDQDTGRSA